VLSLVVALAFGCPHDASLGNVAFDRGRYAYAMSLGDCRERVTGKAATRSSRVLSRSPDGRYAVTVSSLHSASLAADGLPLGVRRVGSSRTYRLGMALAYPDYRTWCGDALVFTAGGDRIATHNKRLLVARAPSWRPRALWAAPGRAFGSVACAPDGKSVVVLSQRDSNDANFFHTKWELWRVRLDGTRTLLDRPPSRSADESPSWSRDGKSLLFVRERGGRGRLWLWRGGRTFGPLANLGYSLGYYGHHDWPVSWRGGRA
jgi:hypothetical protein